MLARPLVLVAVLAGCGGRAAPSSTLPAMSFEAHMREAATHEQAARGHDEQVEVMRSRGENYQCDTHPESEQTTSGTERLPQTRVCSDVSLDARRRHEREARAERRQADEHRAAARALVATERAACDGLPVSALTEPPLVRAGAIVAATPIERGVRVELRETDAARVRAEVGCFRARAATSGHDPAYMPKDPTVLTGTDVSVEVGPGGRVVVTVTARDEATAAQARSRVDTLRARP